MITSRSKHSINWFRDGQITPSWAYLCRLETPIKLFDIFFNYHNPLTIYQMADCPLCTGARGINKKEEFIEHLDSHQEMAMNHDMMFRKFKEYVLAHENFTE